MSRPLLFVLLVSTAACGPRHVQPEPEEPVTCDSALSVPKTDLALEVLRDASGGGTVPLATGDTLQQQFGAQGGSHFFVYARVYSAEASTWLVDAKLAAGDGTVLAAGSDEFQGCQAQWITPRALRVFIESGGALAGTLTVKAKAQQGAPLIFEAPITVGQGL